MPRPQFTLRALLVLVLAVACFFGGIRFERERRRREDEAAEYAAELRRWESASKAAATGVSVQMRPHPDTGRILRKFMASDPDGSDF